MADRTDTYAQAMLDVARAEGDLAEVEDELFRLARIFEGNDELRVALSDLTTPPVVRQQIIERLLEGRVTPTTMGLVSMVVGAGRGRDLPAIVKTFVDLSAQGRQQEVAEVRSAVDLTEDQRKRLAVALSQATGKAIEVKVILDPTVLGGLITQIGDTVIDGTVRSKLVKLRERLG
ncbi:MAG: ATP synthase F1 subunit delta [Acidimicrobiales bacterium]